MCFHEQERSLKNRELLSERQKRRRVDRAVEQYFSSHCHTFHSTLTLPSGTSTRDGDDGPIDAPYFSTEMQDKAEQNLKAVNDKQGDDETSDYYCTSESDDKSSDEEIDKNEETVWDELIKNEEKFCMSDTILVNELGNIFRECKISHSAINQILHVLLPFHPSLPRDARTILKTPRETAVTILENGQYSHIGLITGLLKTFSFFPSTAHLKVLEIQINIDGMSLYRSGFTECWPILGKCKLEGTSPFVIGLFCGEGKPSPLSGYLEDFINEVKNLQANGFVHNNITYRVKIRSYICDSPARSYLKCVKGHNSSDGCERCSQEGNYKNHRMIYSNKKGPLRTDQSFREMRDADHHNGKSPLCALDTRFISHFPLDPMHLIDYGVMKKFLEFLKDRGPSSCRLSAKELKHLSDCLCALKPMIPLEFSRKPQSIKKLSKWKSTEFRLILLYVGPVVFQYTIPVQNYHLFLLLHCATFILSSKLLIENLLQFAEESLRTFVENVTFNFGDNFLSYNTHNLLHVCDDVKLHGPLTSYSAYPFENYLGVLKKLVRSSQRPLQQLCRRIAEVSEHTSKTLSKKCILSKEHALGPLSNLNEDLKQFHKCETQNYILTCSRPDNCVCFLDGEIGLLQNICQSSKIVLIVKLFKNRDDLYVYPRPSRDLGIWRVDNIEEHFTVYEFSMLKAKCILLPVATAFAAMPLLHLL